jgi:hypothetical protein
MQFKTLIAAAVTAAFAFPLAALAGGDKASSGATKSDGGAEAMFKSMDKDKNGSISKDEAKGTPHDKDFAKLDKNNDGKLSPQEHAAAPEHASKASTGATSSGGASGSTKSSK